MTNPGSHALSLVLMAVLIGVDARAQFVSYSTPGPFALTLTAGPDGVSVDGQVSLVTPIGTFSLGTSYPAIRNHTVVVLRDRKTEKERVYRIETRDAELQVDVDGRGRVTVRDREVIIDMTDGVISKVRLKTWPKGTRARHVKSLLIHGGQQLQRFKYAAALEKFSEAVRFDETNVDALMLRSYTYLRRNVWPDFRTSERHRQRVLPLAKAAVADARKAVGLAPKDADANRLLGMALGLLAAATSDQTMSEEASTLIKRAEELGWNGWNTSNILFHRNTVFDRYDIRIR